eukprot:jgi/Mesvir1/20889/Mv07965-RA.1
MAVTELSADDKQWLREAVIRFLQGPMYVTPLMGFIDQHCAIFDLEEENKLEYTIVHQKFMAVVSQLLEDFLEELGVSQETFYEAVSSTSDLNSFVVHSILAVEDFAQFKAMMVRRNLDLTKEVLAAMHASSKAKEAGATPPPEPTPMPAPLPPPTVVSPTKHEPTHKPPTQTTEAKMNSRLAAAAAADAPSSMSKEELLQLEQALQLSAATFQHEHERGSLPREYLDMAATDEQMAAILEASALEAQLADMALKREMAELEQALAMSLAIEQESQLQRQAEEEERRLAAAAAEAAGAASSSTSSSANSSFSSLPSPVATAIASPMAAALAAPPPSPVTPTPRSPVVKPAPVPAPAASPAPAVPTTTPAAAVAAPSSAAAPAQRSAPAVQLPAVQYRSNIGTVADASGMAALAADQRRMLRQAAEEAARSQREMLARRKEEMMAASIKAREGHAGAGSAPFSSSTTGGISKEELEKRQAYLQQQRDALIARRQAQREKELEASAAGASAGAPATAESEMDRKRAELRRELARRMKQELLARQMEKM